MRRTTAQWQCWCGKLRDGSEESGHRATGGAGDTREIDVASSREVQSHLHGVDRRSSRSEASRKTRPVSYRGPPNSTTAWWENPARFCGTPRRARGAGSAVRAQSSSLDGTTTRNTSDVRSITTVAGSPSARRRAAYSSAGHDPRGAPAGNLSNTRAPIGADTSSVLRQLRSPTFIPCGCPSSAGTCIGRPGVFAAGASVAPLPAEVISRSDQWEWRRKGPRAHER